jgi:hypothetical protein
MDASHKLGRTVRTRIERLRHMETTIHWISWRSAPPK